ncbi:MAG: hypothetical protein KAQ85_07360 [Thermodesulfovibrionia bacterium]|nr:hypothetical protein [Thermodesulfovibrionia bacterium]
MISSAFAIFLISAAALGFQLVLVRALAIGQWHHFSYFVISTALLGFGFGATAATIFSSVKKHYYKTQWLAAICMGAAVPMVFYLSQKVPLQQIQLIWDRKQILYLAIYYLLFSVPFLFAGSIVAMAFERYSKKAHYMYFYNMTGSALGSVGAVVLMYLFSPVQLVLVVSSICFASAICFSVKLSSLPRTITVFAATAVILLFSRFGPLKLEINISENKSLVYYNNLPGARNSGSAQSPLGQLNCIKADAIRHFPGLSFAFKGELPKQMLIINDGDSISAVNHFEDVNDLICYDYMSSALSYHLIESPEVCIIGAGGGSDAAQALMLKADKIIAVEINPQIIDMVANKFNDFAGRIYENDKVKIVIADGRSFLQSCSAFDIINISLLDSFAVSATGIYALNESNLYTIEAISQAIDKLKPNGILSVTRVLKTPPRDSLKMLATFAEVLRRRKVTDIKEHIIMIRSWATATILASAEPFSQSQIAKTRQFAKRCRFDLVHLPDINAEDVNIFHKLDKPVYYQYTERILSPDFKHFFSDYAYNIAPATDDRPYYYDFFKCSSLPYIIRSVKGQWLVFSEWGYLILVITLLQAVLASTILILLPIAIAKPIKNITQGKLATFGYFFLVGLGYMFLEMGFIAKMTLLIGHPVWAIAVTILSFLLFSAFGALTCKLIFSLKYSGWMVYSIYIAVAAIIVTGLLEILAMRFFFNYMVQYSFTARLVISFLMIAPLAFFMGIPFPFAIKKLGLNSRPLIPWALGINGFASVIAAVGGTLLAISLGFTNVSIIALGCYFLAGAIVKKI